MQSSNNLLERVIKGSSIVLLLTFLVTPLGYLIRTFYSRTLSIEDYGLFFAVNTFFNLIAIYTDLGFGYTVSYLIPKHLKSGDHGSVWNIFRYYQMIQILTTILVSAILFLSAKYLAVNFFKMESAVNLIYISCIYLLAVSFFNTLVQLFIGLQKEKYYASMNLVRLFFTLSFSIIFFLFDLPNIIFYSIAWVIGYSLAAVIYTPLS